MTSISKNVYHDKLADIVNKYNNTYHSKYIVNKIRYNTYTGFIKENNKKDPNYKVGDHVRISKYKTLHSKLVWKSFFD